VHVCLVAVEILAWGKYGGFGRATRTIGRELVQRGITVSAVVPRRAHQAPIENLDGIRVHGLTLPELLATRAGPKARHVVTYRDTRDAADWRTERGLPSASKLQVLANRLYEDNWLVHRAVRRADLCCVAARMLAARAQAKYGLAREPEFLPTPVVVPERVEKDREPTVCFVARWDRRKRPELFFSN
jgi:hypothetical protein